MALCCHLAFWTGKDAGRVDTLFRRSKLYRDEKWGRADYRRHTIDKAIDLTGEIYDQNHPRFSGFISMNVSSGAQGRDGIEPGRELDLTALPATQLQIVLRTFQRWLHMPDPAPLYTILGTVAANLISGDPLWCLIIGPPGSGKTELLQSVSGLPNVHTAGTITEAALLSATPARDKSKDASGGLLRKVGVFGILLLKDFTSILSMNRDSRMAVLAALREIYDGSWTRQVGTDGGRTLSWEGKLALIACCTPTIDSHHAVMATMGERFVLYRLPSLAEAEVARYALTHIGQEATMRDELMQAVKAFFSNLELRTPLTDENDTARLTALATLAVRCRSAVERDSYSREIQLVPEPEAPGRLALALSRLLTGMRAVGVPNREAWGVTAKVALDCMPALRLRVSGHKTRSVFDRYNIVNDRDLTDAAVRMEQHLRSLGILPGIPGEERQPNAAGEKSITRLQ